MYEKSHDNVPSDILVGTYDFLGQGYQKKEETQKAIAAFKKVIEIAPDSDLAVNAKNSISKIQTAAQQEVTVERERNTSEDVENLTKQVKADPDNPVFGLDNIPCPGNNKGVVFVGHSKEGFQFS